MFQTGLAFLGGYACRAQCGSLPCQARLRSSGTTLKLGVVVHSATLADLDGPGLIENQRPLVCVSVGDRTKETELGDWCKEKGQWCFRECITVVVNVNDEICLSVSSTTRYNLFVASVSLTKRSIGEICFQVSHILPRLRVEDRDMEGLVYSTPVLSFDIVQGGRCTGRVFLSFETKSAPPSQKALDADKCCGWGASGVDRYRMDDDTTASDQLSSRSTPRWDFARDKHSDTESFSTQYVSRGANLLQTERDAPRSQLQRQAPTAGVAAPVVPAP